jgi:4-amino-4-deoxy-L-arabinose transferase-like glycosyltransferase
MLLLPALLINLGLIAFYDDEAIRALVALEMQISGNYITPTMFGEFYYNKPPLYNWILLVIFDLTGENSELVCRLVTVFFLLVYAGSAYYFFQKNLKEPQSAHSPFTTHHLPLISALALITCGRILFWDSMLGLIDICFSWVMFLLFMVIYQKGEKEDDGALFGWAYLLAAIGYLLKGLPAVVFLGLALLTYFIWQKKIKRLFSWFHVLGGAIFSTIVGGYYFLYAQQNGLEEILKTVFDESAKRTFIEHGFGKTILHLFSFPFEMWYHFLPWTLLVICFFQKNIFQKIKENKFITWNLLVLLTTILPYWSAVEVYPRYLFMHVPLAFSAFFYFYLKNKEEKGWQANMVEMIFFAASCLSVIAALLPIGWDDTQDVPYLLAKSIGLSVFFILLTYLFWTWKPHRMLVFVLVLLTARIGYNFFILPSRLKIECSTEVRESSHKAVELAGEKPIYIYKNSLGFQPMTGYYFTRETGKILRKHYDKTEAGAFYIVLPNFYDRTVFDNLMKLKIKWQCRDIIFGQAWPEKE